MGTEYYFEMSVLTSGAETSLNAAHVGQKFRPPPEFKTENFLKTLLQQHKFTDTVAKPIIVA
jgi:hypothetical protein